MKRDMDLIRRILENLETRETAGLEQTNGVGWLPERTGARAHAPHRSGAPRTCSLTAGMGRTRSAVQGNGAPVLRCLACRCRPHTCCPAVNRAGAVIRGRSSSVTVVDGLHREPFN